MDAWRMKQMKDTKKINLQRRKRKLADLLEKERLEHTVRNVQKSYSIYYIDNRRRQTMAISTLGPACNEFGYNEHPLATSEFLCIKIIDSNVEKPSDYQHPPTTSNFLCTYLLVLSENHCMCSFWTYFLNTNVKVIFVSLSGSTQGLLEGQLCSD